VLQAHISMSIFLIVAMVWKQPPAAGST
jgi:hypothetical protein